MTDLHDNVLRLEQILRSCQLCPRRCRVDRTAGQIGACRIGATAKIASVMPHFGEEPVLVGGGGSGAIFFAGCNLACLFCQNFDISHTDDGQACSPEQIAATALKLMRLGCENVNFVTPTHVAHAVARAVLIARERGLSLPVVYNCGGYESLEVLQLLDGLIDIYMPDFKYADAAHAKKYSHVDDYPAVAAAALAQMYGQVGPLQLDNHGVARRGVLVRHLVMPHDLAHSCDVIDIVARTAPGCTINIMAQYRPAHRAREFPELCDYPSAQTVRSLQDHARRRGLICIDD